MNYVFYIVVFISVVAIVSIPWYFRQKLLFGVFYSQLIRIYLQQQKPFFSSDAIALIIKCLIKKRNKQPLFDLLDCKYTKVEKALNAKSPIVKIQYEAMHNLSKAIKKLEKIVKKNPKQHNPTALLAVLYRAAGNYEKESAAWDNVKESKLSRYNRAQYKSFLANRALKNGDLEFASQLFYQAANLFNKQKAFFEEASVYLRLGTIYRVCFVDDTAEMLFLSALKIFQEMKYPQGIAQTYANCGLLMMGQERFEEAESYLQKSLDIYTSEKMFKEQAEINNQQALLYLLNKDYKTAKKYLKLAETLHSEQQNTAGTAFNFELQANWYWQNNKYSSAAQKAHKAANLYKLSNNISGLLESMYLEAQAVFKQNNDTKAERILRQIIDIGKHDCGCFYLANAYNLLGIIFVKRRDLRRAKGLFQQSLDLEQRGVRSKAIAADYANIGLLEMSCGHREDAQKNLQTAYEYALSAGDDDLCLWLQDKINKSKN